VSNVKDFNMAVVIMGLIITEFLLLLLIIIIQSSYIEMDWSCKLGPTIVSTFECTLKSE